MLSSPFLFENKGDQRSVPPGYKLRDLLSVLDDQDPRPGDENVPLTRHEYVAQAAVRLRSLLGSEPLRTWKPSWRLANILCFLHGVAFPDVVGTQWRVIFAILSHFTPALDPLPVSLVLEAILARFRALSGPMFSPC